MQNNLENISTGLIQQMIIETIIFFDLFDYPLTALEIWKYLPGKKISYNELIEILDNNNFDNKIENIYSFYVLSGRSEIVTTKMKRYNFTDQKFERAIRLFKIFKYVPGIKMIAIGNLIGSHNLKEDGDIDLFIVTEPGRSWSARFFLALGLEILGLRPKPGKEKNKICLSFFVDIDNLNMQRLLLKDEQNKINDPYFIYWLAGLVPIYDVDNIYDRLIFANKYIFEILPNWIPGGIHHERQISMASIFWQKLSSGFIKYLEKPLRNWQMKRFPKEIKNLLNKDTRVVADDGIIKLHVNDRREEHLSKFKLCLIKKIN